MKKKEDQPEKPEKGKSINAIIKQNENNLEEMASELVHVLYPEKDYLMVSRINSAFGFMLMKHEIISKLYVGYYGACKVDIKLEPISVAPFYKRTVDIKVPDKQVLFQKIMSDINDELQKMTIAFDGEGRKEGVEILQALVGRVNEDKKLLGMNIG